MQPAYVCAFVLMETEGSAVYRFHLCLRAQVQYELSQCNCEILCPLLTLQIVLVIS